MTTKLTHPDSKHVVETDDPAMYLSQGWVEGESEESGVDLDSVLVDDLPGPLDEVSGSLA